MVDARHHPLDRLSAYLDGALDPADRTAVEEHLRACADCRRVLDDLGVLAAAMRDQAAPVMPADLRARVVERLRKDGAPARVIPFRRRFAIPAAAAATIGAVALLAVVTLRQRSDEPAPPQLAPSPPPVTVRTPEPEGAGETLAKEQVEVAVPEPKKPAPAPRPAPRPAPLPRFEPADRRDEADRSVLAAAPESAPAPAPAPPARSVAADRTFPTQAAPPPCTSDRARRLGEWDWSVRDQEEALVAIREAVEPARGRASFDATGSGAVEVLFLASDYPAIREAIERLGGIPRPSADAGPEGQECLRMTVHLTESTPE